MALVVLTHEDFKPDRGEETYRLLVKSGSSTAVFTPDYPSEAFIDFVAAKKFKKLKIITMFYEDKSTDTGIFRLSLC